MLNKKTKSILLELGIYTLIFFVAITLFPICNYYYLEGEEEKLITKPQYIYNFPIFYSFMIYVVLIGTSFLSLKKWVITTVNWVVLLLNLFTISIIFLGFVYWGSSPIHPSFGMGFWVGQLCLSLLIIRTFMFKKHITALTLSQKFTRIFYFFTIIATLVFITLILIAYYLNRQKPRYSSGSEYTINERNFRTESWDYMNAYGAHITKYYTKPNYKVEKYHLDSVAFDYLDDNGYITKQFTKKAVHGKVDIEKILEEND